MPTDKESVPPPGLASIEPQADSAWFSRIADNKIFLAAPMLRVLLLYLWEHRGENISEYAIAVEALGRRPDFNAKIDATVRVQIARLRVKLKEFYQTEDEFPWLVSIPLGSHQLQCERRPPVTAPALPGVGRRRQQIVFGVLCSAAVGLAVISGFLLVENRNLQRRQHLSTASPGPLPRFWQAFLAGGETTSIVVPNPTYFYWREQEIMVRDQKVSEFTGWSTSPLLRQLAAKWGPPVVNENWMTAMEVLSSVQIIQYLERNGRAVQMVGSSSIPMDLTNRHNVIFLGGPRTTGYMQDVFTKTNFHVVRPYPIALGNRKPKAGEPEEYTEVVQSDQRRTCPGLITLLPRSVQGTRALILMGRFTSALASMLLSEEGLDLLDQQWNANGRPDSWEMVVQTEVRGDTVLRVRPVAIREIVTLP